MLLYNQIIPEISIPFSFSQLVSFSQTGCFGEDKCFSFHSPHAGVLVCSPFSTENKNLFIFRKALFIIFEVVLLLIIIFGSLLLVCCLVYQSLCLNDCKSALPPKK